MGHKKTLTTNADTPNPIHLRIDINFWIKFCKSTLTKNFIQKLLSEWQLDYYIKFRTRFDLNVVSEKWQILNVDKSRFLYRLYSKKMSANKMKEFSGSKLGREKIISTPWFWWCGDGRDHESVLPEINRLKCHFEKTSDQEIANLWSFWCSGSRFSQTFTI